MEVYKGLCFTPFEERDVEILTPIMKKAFDEDTRIHLNEPSGGPDGYDNGEFLRKYALHKDSQAYKISWNNKPVGAVIVWINKNKTISSETSLSIRSCRVRASEKRSGNSLRTNIPTQRYGEQKLPGFQEEIIIFM